MFHYLLFTTLCVLFFFFLFPSLFFHLQTRGHLQNWMQISQKVMADIWKVQQNPWCVKKICTIKNTWGVLKVISESGLWERTLLAILMIPSCKKVVKPRASWVNIFFPNNCIAFLELKKIGQKLQQIQYIITVSVVLAVQNLCLMKSWETHICTWPLLVRTEKLSKEA